MDEDGPDHARLEEFSKVEEAKKTVIDDLKL